MNKIPLPVVIGVCILAIALMVFVVSRTLGRSGESGDTATMAAQVIQNNPKSELPPGANPTAGTMMRGGKKGN